MVVDQDEVSLLADLPLLVLQLYANDSSIGVCDPKPFPSLTQSVSPPTMAQILVYISANELRAVLLLGENEWMLSFQALLLCSIFLQHT